MPVIRPAKNKVHTAVVTDDWHQAGRSTPVASPVNQPVAHPIERAAQQRANEGGLCKCGMARANTPHLCIRWHPAMMNGAAPQELSEVVRKYVRTGDLQPLVTVDMQSADTLAYIRDQLSVKGTQLMRWATDLNPSFRDDRGRKLSFVWGPTDAYGITELSITAEEDPAWIQRIVENNTVQRSTSAMPACCDRPDPRIGKSGRPFCANCKRYLDKVPKPVEAPVVETKR